MKHSVDCIMVEDIPYGAIQLPSNLSKDEVDKIVIDMFNENLAKGIYKTPRVYQVCYEYNGKAFDRKEKDE